MLSSMFANSSGDAGNEKLWSIPVSMESFEHSSDAIADFHDDATSSGTVSDAAAGSSCDSHKSAGAAQQLSTQNGGDGGTGEQQPKVLDCNACTNCHATRIPCHDSSFETARPVPCSEQMNEQALEDPRVSYPSANKPMPGMEVQNADTVVADASPSAPVSMSTGAIDWIRDSSHATTSHADSPQLEHDASCPSSNCREADLFSKSSTTSNTTPREDSDTVKISVALFGGKSKKVLPVRKTATVHEVNEVLRQDRQWPLTEELTLMVEKQDGPHSLEDRLTFNEIMADLAIVKPSKAGMRQGRCLEFWLHAESADRYRELERREHEERERREREEQERRAQQWARERWHGNSVADKTVAQKMCPQCGMGPVVNYECSNLQTHNVNGTNMCPECHFFAPKWQEWDEWNESHAIQLRNRRSGGSLAPVACAGL